MSRLSLAIYAGLGVALLLIGTRALGGVEQSGAGDGGGVHVADGPLAAGGDLQGGGGDLVVHVAGAVRDPGVYRLPAGSRVTDAVDRAGGPSGDALVDGINLAAMLADGQQVVVPSSDPTSVAAGTATEDGPISLGSATETDLETIDGIGPVTAADIVAYRDEHGGVASVEELDEVPGIGPATLEALGERLQP